MAQLISGTYKLDDDEAIAWLAAATATSFTGATSEVESVEVVIGADGERSLIVVVGPKG